jgi:hypothetical protein
MRGGANAGRERSPSCRLSLIYLFIPRYASATAASIAFGTRANATLRHQLQAARLQGEPQVHRLHRIAERTRPREIGHMPSAEDMDRAAIPQPERLDALGLI